MKYFILVVVSLALGSAQFVPYDPYTTTEPTRPRWTGPLADHVNGVVPQDTPEVAAAKARLNQAYSQVLTVLPVLPDEIRYQMTGVLQPIKQAVVMPQIPQNIPQPIPQRVQEPVQEAQVPQFTQYAEEIPRSPLGEVPEVHAARVAHLKAYEAARAALPPLTL